MLSDLYPPVIGGGERHVQSLSIELAKRGHEVSVCTIAYPASPEYKDENGVKIYRIQGAFQKMPFLFKDTTRRWHPPCPDWLVTRKLKQIVSEQKPDIAHAHGRILYSVLPLKRELKIPLVVTLHTYWLICPKVDLFRKGTVCDTPFTFQCVACGKASYGIIKSLAAYSATKIYRQGLKAVDKLIAVSPFVREVHLRHLGLEDEDIVTIPNFYAPGTEESRIHNGFPEDFILFVGSLIPQKGVNTLIEAYQKLDTQTKLVMIGAVHPDCHYAGTENISIIENAAPEIVTAAYQKCRFAVVPSISPEPCSTVAFEAMHHKKAAIVSRIGGLTYVAADGEAAVVTPPNNVEALSNAMQDLLENPQVAQDIGQKGHERWRLHFTPEVVVPKIEELYRSLV